MSQDRRVVDLDHIREVKARYESELLSKANVVSVGIGLPLRDGEPVAEPGIVVSVTHKVKANELAPQDLIPQQLDDVRVWIEAVDRPHAINN